MNFVKAHGIIKTEQYARDLSRKKYLIKMRNEIILQFLRNEFHA